MTAKSPIGNKRPFRMITGIARLSDLADGGAAASLLAHGGGTEYYLDPTDGIDGQDGLTPETAVKTLTAGYALLTDGENDILYYIAGTSSITLSAALTWAKSYTHLIGVCSPVHAGQRARIFQLAASNISPLITISGSGCVWANIYSFQGVDIATSLIDVKVTGQRNYFYNVHFAGGGHATQAVNGGASLNVSGSAAENLFESCTIGVDTIAAATGMMGLLFDGGTADIHTTRNMFRDCLFAMKAGAAGAGFVESMTIYDFDRYTIFDRCTFLNLAAQAMTTAFVLPSGIDANDKRIILRDCELIGAPDWDASDRGLIYLNSYTRTGGGNSGILLVSAAA